MTIVPLHIVGCAKFSPPGDLSTQGTEAQKHCQVRSVGGARPSLDWAGTGRLEAYWGIWLSLSFSLGFMMSCIVTRS